MKSSDNRVASLAEWLEIATDGIASSGRERITREIETHFEEAVESHLAKGEPQEIAQASALAELGNAKAAWRRFRKRHLTKLEESRLEEFQHHAGSKLWLIIFIFMSFPIEATLLKKLPLTYALLFCIPILLVYAVFPAVTFWRLRQPEPKSSLSLVAMIQFKHSALSCFVLALLAFAGSKYFFLSLMLVQPFIHMLVHSFRALNKFRKNQNPAIGT